MSDLAAIAGISKSTVSRALAGSELVSKETRDKVKALAEKHGYRMDARARNFRLKNILTIGVLLPSNGSDNWLAANPFILEMLGSISDQLELRGHELLLAKHSVNDPTWIEEFAHNRSVDGIIVLGQSIYHDTLNRIAEGYKNLVVWGAELSDQKYCTVGSDNYKGGSLVAEHLLTKGKQHFVFLGNTDCPESMQRFQGYSDTLEKKDRNYKPFVIKCSENQSDVASKVISDHITNKNEIDAIFASSDMLAISAIKAINNNNISIPDEIAIVGYDDITLATYINPTLTSVKQDRTLAGKLLVDSLFEMIENGVSTNGKIPTELICRESSQ